MDEERKSEANGQLILPLGPIGSGELLDEARRRLRQNLRDGYCCPCCDRFAKIYKTTFRWNGATACLAMARDYIHRGSPNDFPWVHLPSLLVELDLPPKVKAALCCGTAAEAAWWGLMEERIGRRKDGSPKTGVYRLTRKGFEFAKGDFLVHKYAYTYNRKCIGFDEPLIDIREAIRQRFDYDALMRR